MQIQQNKLIRAIFNLDNLTNTDQHRKKLKWLKITDYIKYHLLIFIHKIKLGLITNKLRKLLRKRKECKYELRKRNRFEISKIINEKDRRIWIKTGLKIYNKLDDNIVNSNITKFKKLLSKNT